ncbi:uncharacterized protein LOC113465197 [Ceratina calcarata]|uniref:Uncharacterized protein LOC113465197 n=1 Tax=Ceratina calcarata TaxID=156304 RepID=A0AAJ7WG95_9HYME|nr:uncharacterized protein LOC113465197 [Ceratina calcarata]
MTLPLYFSIFWIIGIVWVNHTVIPRCTLLTYTNQILKTCKFVTQILYFWCSENTTNNRKVNFNINSTRRGSKISDDSSDGSDNENYKQRKRKLKYEAKTRWPSRTSVDTM